MGPDVEKPDVEKPDVKKLETYNSKHGIFETHVFFLHAAIEATEQFIHEVLHKNTRKLKMEISIENASLLTLETTKALIKSMIRDCVKDIEITLELISNNKPTSRS